MKVFQYGLERGIVKGMNENWMVGMGMERTIKLFEYLGKYLESGIPIN